MIPALRTAGRLNWRGWLLGIVGAFVSGGAGSIGTFVGISYIDGQDPDHYTMQGYHVLQVMAIAFLLSAIVSLAKFLQIHPMPERERHSNGSEPNSSN